MNDAAARVFVVGPDFVPVLDAIAGDLTAVKKIVVIGAFTLTLCYLVGDLLSPACVVVAADERCIDKLGFGMILIWVGCGSFTLLATLGAAYLGDLQRKGWPSDSEASPDS